MNHLRQALRFTVFLLFLGAVGALAALLKLADLLQRNPIDRAPWARRCFRGATRCLGIRVNCHGKPSTTPTLFVSNHVSWCDIPVIGGTLPMTFLSKSEVGQWPLIGWLARQAGTLFIKRGGGRAYGVADQLAELLHGGQNAIIFPEGTTTAGITVLPFHGKLLKAAMISGVPVQPVSIVYRRDGRLDHLAPFINDDGFIGHLGRLLGKPAPTVSIVFHEPVTVSEPDNLSSLAATLRATVLEGVHAIQAGKLDPKASPEDSRRPLPHLSPDAFR